MRSTELSNVRQESVLAVLCFFKDEARILSGFITPDLFGNPVYKDIASRVIQYIDKFKEPPGNHIADLFDDVLEGKDDKKVLWYEDVINNLYETKDDTNPSFVLSSLQEFIRKQQLKASVTDIAEKLQDDDLEGAENIIEKSRKTSLQLFNPGMVFAKDPHSFVISNETIPDAMPTGIEYLDRIRCGPTKAELLTILAAPGRGKSWGLMHFGKYALLNRNKVLHVTLEMSEERCAQRYMQSIFSIGLHNTNKAVSVLGKDDRGSLIDISSVRLDRPSYDDGDIHDYLSSRVEKIKNRIPLVIKKFPTSSLTVGGLESYVDMLERSEGFIPDFVIVDYADLMSTNSKYLREDLNAIYKNLRGFGEERNIAVATASQSNRSGEDARVLTLKHLGEDYSKAATSDIVLSYNQTAQEKSLGLARLFTAKVRNEESGRTVLLSQHYNAGQFALESALFGNDYWDMLEENSGE